MRDDLATGNAETSKPSAKVSLGLFILALLFFALQSASHPFPGLWTTHLAALMGLEPFRETSHPVWSSLMSGLASLPGMNAVAAANYLNAVLGAVAVLLVYQIVARLELFRVSDRNPLTPPVGAAHGLAAAVSAVYAMVSLPVLIVATRADPLALDVVMLLLAVFWGIRFRATRRMSWWYVFCGWYGVGCSEFSTFILAAPVFAVWWLVMFWRTRTLAVRPLLTGLVFFLVGCAVFLAGAWSYYASPAAEWREFRSYGHVLRYCLGEQYAQIAHTFPKLGWLIIFVIMIAPALFILPRGFEMARDVHTHWGLALSRCAFLLAAMVPLLSLTGSPWQLTRMSPLVITPHLVTALWFGPLVAYGFVMLRGEKDSRGRPPGAWHGYAQAALLAGVAGLLIFGAARSARIARIGHARPLVNLADDALAALGGRTWMATDGALDTVLRLRAARAGREVHLLNLSQGRSAAYLRYAATLFPQSDLQGLAYIGLKPLLDSWISDDPAATDRLASFESPALWVSRGLAYAPDAGLYFGRAATQRVDAAAAWEKNLTFLDRHTNAFGAARTPPAMLEPHYAWAARRLSLFANNCGVLLEDQGLQGQAVAAYARALAFDASNLSALLNRYGMASRAGSAETNTLKDAINRIAGRGGNAPGLRALDVYSGYVREPERFVHEGWSWALSGSAQPRAETLQKALLASDDAFGGRLSAARLSLANNRPEESEEQLRQILRKQPDHLGAHFGLFQVALHRRDFEEAKRLLDRLEQLGMPPEKVLYERAGLDFSAGRLEEAKGQFLKIVQSASAPADAWFALARIAAAQNDTNLLEKATAKLEGDRSYPPALFLLGEQAMQQNRLDEARRQFERVMALDPANAPALERLAQMDYQERDADALRARAAALLAIDPDHAFGNFAVANVHLVAGRLDLAEAAYRKSLLRGEIPLAHNDLAWLLNKKGRTDEALVHALRAVEMSPNDGNFWDTLAGVRKARGEIDQSVEAIEKAVQLTDRKNLLILTTALSIYLDAGRRNKAAEVLESIRASPDRPPADLQREIDDLVKRLKEM